MEKESDVITPYVRGKILKAMEIIRSVVDVIDQENENSYYADKFSYAANLLESLLDEAKEEQKSS